MFKFLHKLAGNKALGRTYWEKYLGIEECMTWGALLQKPEVKKSLEYFKLLLEREIKDKDIFQILEGCESVYLARRKNNNIAKKDNLDKIRAEVAKKI